LSSSKYENALVVIQAGMQLLAQQEHIYQSHLPELQQAAAIGWQAAQQGQVVDGITAMSQIRENLRSRHPPSASASAGESWHFSKGAKAILSKILRACSSESFIIIHRQ
jgi:antitoxin ParD1/3/4